MLVSYPTKMADTRKTKKPVHAASESDLPLRLGRNLATHRRGLGLTQAEVAERLGVDTETLSRFERGKHVPALLTLERLASILGSTCGALLDEATPSPSSHALKIETWLSGMSAKDAAFAQRIHKACYEHLAR